MAGSASIDPLVAAVAGTRTLLHAPPIWRRIAALPYECLLLGALMLVASFPIAGLNGLAFTGMPRLVFQIYLFTTCAVYFTWFWQHGGQTLPMKTWRFKVVDTQGRQLRPLRALLRFFCALCIFGPALLGLILLFVPSKVSAAISIWAFSPMIASVWWCKFDPERQYLHDRVAGTRLINVDST